MAVEAGFWLMPRARMADGAVFDDGMRNRLGKGLRPAGRAGPGLAAHGRGGPLEAAAPLGKRRDGQGAAAEITTDRAGVSAAGRAVAFWRVERQPATRPLTARVCGSAFQTRWRRVRTGLRGGLFFARFLWRNPFRLLNSPPLFAGASVPLTPES